MKSKIHCTLKPGRYQATGSSERLVDSLYRPTLALKESGVTLPEGTTVDDWSFKAGDSRTWSPETVSTLIDANAEDNIPEGEDRFCCITFTPTKEELLMMGGNVRERLDGGIRLSRQMARLAAKNFAEMTEPDDEPLYYSIPRFRYDKDGFLMISWSIIMSLFPKTVEAVDEMDIDLTEEQLRQFVPINSTMMS